MKLENKKKNWVMISLLYICCLTVHSLSHLPGLCCPFTLARLIPSPTFNFYSKTTFPVKFPHANASKILTHVLLSLFFFLLIHTTLIYYIICSFILEEDFIEKKETLIKERHILNYIKMNKASAYIEIGYNWYLELQKENYDKKIHQSWNAT